MQKPLSIFQVKIFSLKAAKKKIDSFLHIYYWLVKDAIFTQKKLALYVVIVSVVGALAMGGIVGTLVFFGKYLDGNNSGIGIQFIDDILYNVIGKNVTSIIILAVILFCMGFISAYAKYISEVKSRELGRHYHWKCTLRVIRGINQPPGYNSSFLADGRPGIMKMIMQRSILSGKSAEFLIGMTLPVFYCLSALVLLIKLQPLLCVLILLVYCLFLPSLYRMSGRVQSISRQYYDTGPQKMSKIVNKIIGLINQEYSDSTDRCSRKYFEGYYKNNDEVNNYFQLFDDFQLLNEQAVFLTLRIQAFMITFVLLFLGIQMVNSNLGWGTLFGFVIALRILSNQLTGLFSTFSNLNRFYPAVERFYFFCKDGLLLQDKKYMPNEVILKSGTNALNSDLNEITLRRGTRIVLVTKTKLNRIEYENLVKPLSFSSTIPIEKWAGIPFFSSLDLFLPAPLYINLGLSSSKNLPDHVKNILDMPRIQEALKNLPQGIETMIDEKVWMSFDADIKFAIKIVNLYLSKNKIVLVNLSVLQELDKETALSLLEILHSKIVIIVSNTPNINYDWIEYAAVADKNKIVAVGSIQWFQNSTDLIRPLIVSERKAKESEEDDLEAVLA